MKIGILFIPFFYIISHLLHSQNTEDQKIWLKIKSIDTISNYQINLQECNTLIKKLEKNKATNDSIYAKILHIFGRTYWNLKKWDLAKKAINQSISINSQDSKFANKTHLALSYMNLAGIEFDLQEYEKSLKNYDLCINLFKKYNFRLDFIANCFNQKANIYFFIGDYFNCILNSDKALSFSGSNVNLIIGSNIEKGLALIELNELKKAEVLIGKTILLAEQNLPESFELASLYSHYGTIYGIKKDIILSRKYFIKSETIYKKLKSNIGIAQTQIEFCNILKKAGRLDESLNFAKKALIYSENDQSYILSAKDEIGIILKLKGKFIESLKIFQSAFSWFLKKDFNENIELNPNPKTISGKVDNDILLSLIQHKAETWLAYYHHTKKKEYLQNALETFAVADKMVDYMRREHVGYQSKLFWRDKTHSLYENAIEVCYLLKNYENAFYFFEKSRAVLLNDRINNLSANQLLTESDQLRERSFQQKISELNAKLNQESNETKISELNVKLLDIQESQQSFVKSLAVKYPSYYAFKYDTSIYDLGQLKQYLNKRNLSFIAYFKGDSANYQLVIKSSGVNLLKQKTTEDNLKYLINANDLGKRVLVSQDGEFVPLDTLKNSQGKYLLHKYAFSYTYSAQYLLRNAESKTPSSSNYFNNFIGFAPVNYSKSMALPTLFGAEKALDEVSQNYFWPQNFQNEKATKSNFKRNASDYKIIQLFTHADADNIRKEPTIFFADSSMKVSELESIGKFKAELLVLSACKTSVGKIIKGEGTLSMAREFASFGIPATITTLWSVENAATYQITELFYKYLKKGEPKDLALQKAKLEFLDTNSREKQNPKYWGAFVLMGEVNPLVIELNAFYWLVGILALVTILAIIYFSFRSKPLIIK